LPATGSIISTTQWKLALPTSSSPFSPTVLKVKLPPFTARPHASYFARSCWLKTKGFQLTPLKKVSSSSTYGCTKLTKSE